MPETFAVSEKLSELTLEDLRFFASIYEELSLSSAALRCGISLSRASRILKKLRETFAGSFSDPCRNSLLRNAQRSSIQR